MHGNGIRVCSKHTLDVIFLERICKVRHRKCTILKEERESVISEMLHHVRVIKTHLQYPRSVAGERVARVDDVSVPGEAAEQVAHALDEGVELGLDQHLRD